MKLVDLLILLSLSLLPFLTFRTCACKLHLPLEPISWRSIFSPFLFFFNADYAFIYAH
jgi:hypothetical protein